MVFITGSTGLVGGHLLIHLLKRGEKVRALKRSTSNLDELRIICDHYREDFKKVVSHTEWVEGDLLDKESLERAMEGVDVVYHCAAIVSFGTYSSDMLKRINVEGTRNIAALALKQKVSCFAFVSSIGALGQAKEGETITEETPWDPENTSSVYSNSKYASEQEVWKASEGGLNVVIVNPGIILGPDDFTKGSLKFFSVVKKGMPFYLPQQSGYVDVRDVCAALLLLTDRCIYNQRFILVSENLTNKQLFTLIARAVGKPAPFIPVGKRLLQLACHLDAILSRITGKSPLVTPEIVRSGTKKEIYSSEKFIRTTGFTFMPVKCDYYR